MKRQADMTKVILLGVFTAVFALFSSRFSRRHAKALDLTTTDLVLLGLSTFRLGRLVAYDKILEPLRQPVAMTRPDETGAGETTEPRGAGARRTFGELITCPICAGTWIAAGLVYALHLWPGATRLFLVMTGSIGSAELLNALTENLSWSGQASRKEAGDE
jgi:hypothetical protein